MPTPTTPGAATRIGTIAKTSPASARAPRWRGSADTATCSRRGATSVPRRPPTTASRSRRSWGG